LPRQSFPWRHRASDLWSRAIKPIDPAIAREAHDYRLKSRAVAATFHYFARRVLKQEHDVLE
jgi:hypothetical protein